MSYEAKLYELIKSLSYPLKSGLDLELALKARLTKKEFKLLKAWVSGVPESEIMEKMKLDSAAYKSLSAKLVKKLNQERVKQTLYDYHKDSIL